MKDEPHPELFRIVLSCFALSLCLTQNIEAHAKINKNIHKYNDSGRLNLFYTVVLIASVELGDSMPSSMLIIKLYLVADAL